MKKCFAVLMLCVADTINWREEMNLGHLFKTTGEEVRRTKLLILITPRVVRKFNEDRAVTAELRSRMTGLEVLERRLVPRQSWAVTQ